MYWFRNDLLNSALREMRRAHGEVNRVFETGEMAGVRFPAINLHQGQDVVLLTAELPGVDPAGLDISVLGNALTLKGTRSVESPTEDGTWHRRERFEGEFLRTIELPWNPDAAKVEASYRHGVLTVRVPRAEADKPRQIAVQA